MINIKFPKRILKKGPPQILNKREIEQVISYIQICHFNNEFPILPTFSDVQRFIKQQFEKDIKFKTLNNLITIGLSNLLSTKLAKPMEITRMEDQIKELGNNLNCLKEEVANVPIEFIMNLDEMGSQDFADSELKTVIVPHDYTQSFAPYPIDRKRQRYTVIAYINSLRVVVKPLFAVKRSYGDIQIYRHLPLNSLEIIHTKKGYKNSPGFELYLKTIFILALRELRERYDYSGRAVLIMDNYGPHKIALEKVDIKSENVIVHFLPPHSYDQVQPLNCNSLLQCF